MWAITRMPLVGALRSPARAALSIPCLRTSPFPRALPSLPAASGAAATRSLFSSPLVLGRKTRASLRAEAEARLRALEVAAAAEAAAAPVPPVAAAGTTAVSAADTPDATDSTPTSPPGFDTSLIFVNPHFNLMKHHVLVKLDEHWLPIPPTRRDTSFILVGLCVVFLGGSVYSLMEWSKDPTGQDRIDLERWSTTCRSAMTSPSNWPSILTYACGHKDEFQLIGNGLAILAFGTGLAWRHGMKRTMIIAVVSAITGALTVYATPHRIMGASGIVYGLGSAYTLTLARDMWRTRFPYRMRNLSITLFAQAIGTFFFIAWMMEAFDRLQRGKIKHHYLADWSHLTAAFIGGWLGLFITTVSPRTRFPRLPSVSLAELGALSFTRRPILRVTKAKLLPVRALVSLEAAFMLLLLAYQLGLEAPTLVKRDVPLPSLRFPNPQPFPHDAPGTRPKAS